MSVYSEPPQTGRETQISRQIGMMDKGLSELAEVCNLLEQRLGSILQEEKMVKESNSAKADPLVSLAADLSGKNSRIDAITDRIKRLIERIEL